MKAWLEVNKMKTYSTLNERKSVTVEEFIGTLKNKTYKHMTSKSKNMYISKLDDIFNKYNLKMNPVYAKPNIYFHFI